MDREKQIEEMAELICDNKDDRGVCSTDGCVCNYNCEYRYSAEALYDAGYRKQSEGEWLTSDIPQEKYVCSICGGACWYYDCQGEVARSRYCPNCGAKMKGA